MEKTLALALQAAAALVFVFAGAAAEFTDGFSLFLTLPASLYGIGGLVLWSRGSQPSPMVPPPPPQPHLTDGQVVRLQEAIAILQEDVNKLREDRDFFQKLYSGAGVPELGATRGEGRVR